MKQHLQRTIPVLFFALLALACSRQEQPPAPVKPGLQAAKQTGEALFQERCSDCHTVQEKGGVIGPDLSKVGSIRNKSYLEQVIREPSKTFPGTVMPPHGIFSFQQIKSLVDYLSNLK